MKLSKKLIAVPAIALAAGIGLAACGSSGGSNNSGPALRPGSATATQVCNAIVGDAVTNTSTGQNTGETVESATTRDTGGEPDSTSDTVGDGTAGQPEIKTCWTTLSDGTALNTEVTLFPNGSIGWHAES